ncbi:hypothetical protein JTE90_018682 [Oedothorax gibbosus]|uniref:Uncharacterized protein n=1 Tax=Oedothorax gibbosus TaxID=931172 RepID=A0AAV6V2Q2_9ARAC|nr:hypothetical protein JTE90_018682 [Oedothorax gibbosus]
MSKTLAIFGPSLNPETRSAAGCHVKVPDPWVKASIREYIETQRGEQLPCWSLIQSLVSRLSKPFREASKILRKALVGSEGGEAHGGTVSQTPTRLLGSPLVRCSSGKSFMEIASPWTTHLKSVLDFGTKLSNSRIRIADPVKPEGLRAKPQ